MRGSRSIWLLLLLALVACSQGQTLPPAGTPVAVPAAAPVNLFLWHGWSSDQVRVLTSLVDAYNGSQSAVRVVPQRAAIATMADDLQAATATGGGPHLMLIPNRWIGRLAADGVLLPLDDYVAADRQLLLLTALAGAEVRGADGKTQLYGLPIGLDTVALYYNQSNYPEAPSDTATMVATAGALSDPDASPRRWGMAYNLSLDATIGYLYAFGGRVFDEQGQLVLGDSGRSGVEKWLQWQLDLSQDPRLRAVPDGVLVSQEIASNQVLMTIDWAHNLATYQRLWGDQLGVTPLPPLADGAAPTPYVVGEVAAINARASAAEHQAALDFIRFLLEPASQQILWQTGRIPVQRELAGDQGQWAEPQALQAFHSQAAQGTPALNHPTAPVVERVLRQMQRDVLRGLASPSDAVSQASQALEGLVPNMKN